MNEKTHLDLFSGIGGFALAARWNGYRTVGFCDCEPYAQAVLKKHWPEVPIHKDIREIRGDVYAGVTLLTGGFPCQPFSVAGERRGKDDNRYLWPEMLRVIREAKPRWIIGENVAGIVNMALDQVHSDLEGEGYEVETLIIPACAVDAPHRRDRCWIVANSKCNGQSSGSGRGGVEEAVRIEQVWENNPFNSSGTGCVSSPKHDVADSISMPEGGAYRKDQRKCERGRKEQGICQRNQVGSNPPDGSEDVADSDPEGWEGWLQGRPDKEWEDIQRHLGRCGSAYGQSGEAIWLPEPNMGRVAHGVPNRTHRLKGLGNAIVPQVASEIIKCINLLEKSIQ